jgi:hypothetical protein
MRQYTTLFDSNYLAKGLAMYTSLKRHSSEAFMLHILCMDRQTAEILDALKLECACLYPLDAFEIELQLKSVTRDRDWREYCWTLASVFTDYVLEKAIVIETTHAGSKAREFIYGTLAGIMDEITYLDADLFFFSDPEPVFAEIGSRSIAVTPHRLIPQKKYLEVNGKFNVGWVTFKADAIGRECVRHWAQQCRDRCSSLVGCGDQKYLDEWPERYGAALCEIQHIGCNAAPWNVGNWNVDRHRDSIDAAPRLDGQPIICFHFHEFNEGEDGRLTLTHYRIRAEDLELIYQPYISAYRAAQERITAIMLLRQLTQSIYKLESERA